MVLDKNSPKPLYAQLEDILRTAILNQGMGSESCHPV